jgi:uncharacterized protein YrrD
LVGNPVFSVRDGRAVGEVKDLILKTGLGQVAGIYLGSEGIVSRTPCHLVRDDVTLFGIDVVLVRSLAAVCEGEPVAADWIRLADLRGRDVATPGGTKVGQIDDVILDEDATIVGFALKSIALKGPVAESRAISCAAVIDPGTEDGIMNVDITKAERQDLRVDPGSLFTAPTVTETGEA